MSKTQTSSVHPERLPGYAWFVLLAWLLFIAGAAYYAPKLEGELKAGAAITPGSESAAVEALGKAEWQEEETHSLVLVFSSEQLTVEEPAFRAGAEKVLNQVRRIDGVQQVESWWERPDPRMLGKDGRTVIALVAAAVNGSDAQLRVVPALREAAVLAPDELTVNVTGEMAVYADLAKSSLKAISESERVVIPVVLIVLAVIFGSLMAAVLPLGLGLISVLTSLGLAYFYAVQRPMDDSTQAVISMIGMGVGVDYSLFMVTRFREELATGLTRLTALRRTIATSGKAILFSGATVIVSVASLYLIPLDMVKALSLAMILVVLVSVLAATTLLPIILYFLGDRVNALRVPLVGRITTSRGFWHRWALAIMRRPWLFTAIAVVPLLALSWPTGWMKTGMPNLSMLPTESDARRGAEVLQAQLGAGVADPIELLVEVRPGTTVAGRENLPRLWNLVQAIKQDPEVAMVISHLSLEEGWDLARYQGLYVDGPAVLGQQFAPAIAQAAGLPPQSAAELDLADAVGRGDLGMRLMIAAGGPQVRETLSGLVNLDRGANLARILIIPKGAGDSPGTWALVERLRSQIIPQHSHGFERALVGGSPAQLVDFSTQIGWAMPRVITLVLLITFLVLLVLLRSLLLPLKAILMNLLSVTAAYGAMVLIFEKGYLSGLLGFTPLGFLETPVVPLLFAILFGLSMDYEVFLLSRVKEVWDRTHDNEEAVAQGLEQTAGIITGAATIMVLVFSAFVATGVLMIKEIGVGLTVAIFLDATLIRIVLAPALMRLMGHWNWWAPAWLLRILPKLEMEH